ncbi:SMI1/KNR4 family protein [Nonomuraea salmonea]|uniref:SMI1/KNR4 family protein n=1 Tax=Nonomuraea salmonea TaxID=46181 RepID=UPI003CD07342
MSGRKPPPIVRAGCRPPALLCWDSSIRRGVFLAVSPWHERIRGRRTRNPLGELHPPATEAEVREFEERLGVELPTSYRQFLMVANGWGGDDDCRLLPLQEAGWLRDVDPSMAEVWSTPLCVPDELYFVYGPDQESIHFRGGVRARHPSGRLLGRWRGAPQSACQERRR